jgi:hypothetical protein
MITLREEQQELETAIKTADNLTRNQLNELGRLTVKYFRLLDRALKENETLKARIAELETAKTKIPCGYCHGDGVIRKMLVNWSTETNEYVCLVCKGTGLKNKEDAR